MYCTNLPAFHSLFTRFRLDVTRSIERLTSWPGVVPVARVKRSASAPYSAMVLSGFTTLPSDLDIFRPCSSRTSPCRNTVLKGASPVNSRPIMIIRATQKKRMSWPVSITVVG